MRADRQTYTLITILRSLTAGEVNNEIQEKERLGAKRLTSDRSAAERDKSHIAVLCYMPPPPRPRSIKLSGTQADTTATGPRAAPECYAYCCSVDSWPYSCVSVSRRQIQFYSVLCPVTPL